MYRTGTDTAALRVLVRVLQSSYSYGTRTVCIGSLVVIPRDEIRLQIMLWGGPVATVRSRDFFVNYPVSFSLRYLYIRPISRTWMCACPSSCLHVRVCKTCHTVGILRKFPPIIPRIVFCINRTFRCLYVRHLVRSRFFLYGRNR